MNPPGVEAARALLRNASLKRLLQAFDDAGEETRIVGGAVRNALLGHAVREVDLATTIAPERVLRKARAAGLKAVPTGIEHGTVTVIVGATPFEVTTLREDIETDGRRAVVRFGRDFAADARRRDFTINALSLDRDGRLHDDVGGVADLEARRVRFIGDPAQRIREDYLRILRFFRFHAWYAEGDIDQQGFEAAIREREGLDRLSRERIGAEFLKLLAGPRAAGTIEFLSEAGLLERLIGGVGEFGRLRRAIDFDSAEGDANPDPVRRLAALAIATQEDADRLRDKLRLSNAEHDRLSGYARLIASLKSIEGTLDRAGIRRIVAEHGLGAATDALTILRDEPRPRLPEEASDALREFLSGSVSVPVFPLRGADLISRGVTKGPPIGEMLARAREIWLQAGCAPDIGKDDLIARVLPGELTPP